MCPLSVGLTARRCLYGRAVRSESPLFQVLESPRLLRVDSQKMGMVRLSTGFQNFACQAEYLPQPTMAKKSKCWLGDSREVAIVLVVFYVFP